MIGNISAVVLAKNNEATIQNTLKALSQFEDVVVYDNGSTDSTIQIAKTFANVHLIQGEFNGFGWTKNRAASFTKNDWVLVVDSEEVVDDALFRVLKSKKLDLQTVLMIDNYSVLYFPLIFQFLNHW